MPRKPRIMSSTGIYHIILRSVNQHIIFEEDSDYQKFLFVLSECVKKYDSQIYAYCLMDNHVHILIHSSQDDLASFFQSLGSKFVRWYNNKYSRSGHLFQDRYYSVAIENDHRNASHYCTDEKALSIFKSLTRMSSTSEVNTLNKSMRNKYVRKLRKKGLTIKQVARLMDVSETTVKRLNKMSP